MQKLWIVGLMIVLIVVSCSVTMAESVEWKPVLRFQSTYVGIAGFFDETFGIVAGDHHHGIEITSDNAATWTQKVVTRVNLWGIDFLDKKTIYCSGNRKVLVTEDGGGTWDFLSEFGDYEPDDCRFIRFSDRQTGWIGTSFSLAQTVDGGKTWLPVNVPVSVREIVAVDGLDKDTSFFLEGGGSLFMTNNAGKDWSELKMPWKGTKVNNIAPLAAIRFTDRQHGTVLMWRKTHQMELWALTTVDGGKQWQVKIIPVKFGGIFLARDGKTLTVSSTNGEISVWRRS